VRHHVGLFDISHMGELILRGPGARRTVQYLTCNDLDRLKEGQCQYSALLTEHGTFVDDIIVYPLGPEKILLCVNAGNTQKDAEWIAQHLSSDTRMSDESPAWCQLAVQGPMAAELMGAVMGPEVRTLKRFYFKEISWLNHSFLVSRTGYTGEDGFEIYGPTNCAEAAWQALYQEGQKWHLKPCGLGARDTLRLEACYPLYGHEIDDQTTPYEAGLGWIVRLKDPPFLGQSALETSKKNPRKHLIAFQLEEAGIPRQGYELFAGETPIGTVASGTLSPSLNVGIGTGFVSESYQGIGTKIAVDIRGKKRNAAVVARPFYKP